MVCAVTPVDAAAPPATPPWRPTAVKLIQDLGDKDYRVRDAAEKRLFDFGPKVLPLLRKAVGNKNVEVRSRARRMLPLVESSAYFAPQRVTLRMDKKPLKTIFDEIGRQTGYKVQVGINGKANVLYSFNFKNETFWDAIDQICRTAKLVVQQSYGDDVIRLYPAEGYNRFVFRDGAFRSVASNFNMNRSVDFGLGGGKSENVASRSENTQLTFMIFSEPKLPFVSAGQPQLEAAYDSAKHSMLLPADSNELTGAGRFNRYYGGGNRQLCLHLQVPIGKASAKAKSVKLIRGSVPVTVLVRQTPVVVTDKILGAKGKKIKVGDHEFVFEDVKKMVGKQYQIRLNIVRLDKVDPNDYSWMNNIYQRLELRDDKGNQYQTWGTSWGNSGADRVQITFTYNGSNVAKIGPPAKFIYMDWKTRVHQVAFEFKDLPLP
jgi:hypothetical protein